MPETFLLELPGMVVRFDLTVSLLDYVLDMRAPHEVSKRRSRTTRVCHCETERAGQLTSATEYVVGQLRSAAREPLVALLTDSGRWADPHRRRLAFRKRS